MSNLPDVIPEVHLTTVVYRKYSYSCSASLKFILHLTVHARCTCPLELGPKLQRSNYFSWSQVSVSSRLRYAQLVTARIAIE